MADIGGTTSGDAPQLDSTRTPCMEAVEGTPVLRAAFSGAMRLNCTLERQPTNPGVLYLSINTGSIWPVSERQRQQQKTSDGGNYLLLEWKQWSNLKDRCYKIKDLKYDQKSDLQYHLKSVILWNNITI